MILKVAAMISLALIGTWVIVAVTIFDNPGPPAIATSDYGGWRLFEPYDKNDKFTSATEKYTCGVIDSRDSMAQLYDNNDLNYYYAIPEMDYFDALTEARRKAIKSCQAEFQARATSMCTGIDRPYQPLRYEYFADGGQIQKGEVTIDLDSPDKTYWSFVVKSISDQPSTIEYRILFKNAAFTDTYDRELGRGDFSLPSPKRARLALEECKRREQAAK